MKWLKSHWELLLFGVLLLYGIGFYLDRVVSPSQPNTVQQEQKCTVNAQSLLQDINAERAKLGAVALTADNSLSVSSRNKLNDMVAQKYYGHNNLDGSTTEQWIRGQGIKAGWSEDLNINALTDENNWTSLSKSPAHYQSLTNPTYTRVGLATQCTDLTLLKSTGPNDNTNLIGSTITDMTVVHLATPEPVIPQSTTTNCEYRYSSLLGRGFSTCN